MAMSEFKRSQILMLSLIATLLFLTPFLSTSTRSTYIYFIIHILIISLGAEAGLLFALPNNNYSSEDDPKQAAAGMLTAGPGSANIVPSETNSSAKVKLLEKSVSEKVSSTVADHDPNIKVMKKCASSPSLFFIGDIDEEEIEAKEPNYRSWYINKEEEEEDEEEEEEVGGISGQELFAKAETFIGNFYLQLKMQRELESWDQLHGLDKEITFHPGFS